MPAPLIAIVGDINPNRPLAPDPKDTVNAKQQFGGGAAQVWATLSAGEDLSSRDEIDTMAKAWRDTSSAICVDVLFAQIKCRGRDVAAPGRPHGHGVSMIEPEKMGSRSPTTPLATAAARRPRTTPSDQ